MLSDFSSELEIFESYFTEVRQEIVQELELRLSLLKSKVLLERSLKTRRQFNDFLSILKLQRKKEVLYRQHLHRINTYYRDLLKESNLSKEQKSNVHNHLMAIGIMFRAFISNSSIYVNQKKALDHLYTSRKRKKSKFITKIRRAIHQDLYSFIRAEEAHLALTIAIFEKRDEDIGQYSHHLNSLERIAKYERRILIIALFFNLLPIHGIGDVLSTPFWATGGVLKIYEHHFKEYHEWKDSQTGSVKDIEEELTKVESLLGMGITSNKS